jgi:hypothetical protein
MNDFELTQIRKNDHLKMAFPWIKEA